MREGGEGREGIRCRGERTEVYCEQAGGGAIYMTCQGPGTWDRGRACQGFYRSDST